jgi:glutamate-ammonia-ligase adenylyltransferase
MFPRFDNLIPDQLHQMTSTLDACGWSQPGRAAACLIELRRLWEDDRRTAGLAPEWYVVLKRVLQKSLSPTLTLESTCDYVRASRCVDDAFNLFTESPRSLEILGRFSSGSPFLTQVLLRDIDSLTFLTQHRRITELKSREEFCAEASQILDGDSQSAFVKLRLYQRREQLRIGMCDIFGLLSLQYITLQLSLLADAMVRLCLELAMKDSGVTEPPFAVLALGKHGGEELNYSSDIDLVLIAGKIDRRTQIVARRMVDGLNEHLQTGFLYRVDLRLRPWGNAGQIVTTTESWVDYLKNHAQLWEKQALLKARFVTGAADVAERMLSAIPKILYTESADSIRSSIRSMKDRIEASLRRSGRNDIEVKLGSGSIRDIEFLVQSLQLIHGADEPRVASANTLAALVRLTDFGILPAADFQQLRDGYVFLRAIEHALQLQHNRQTHEIPQEPTLREWLALRVDYPDETTFMSRFNEHRRVVRQIFDAHFRPEQMEVQASAPIEPRGMPDLGDGHSLSPADAAELETDVRLQELLLDVSKSQTLAVDLVEIDAYRALLLICMPDETESLTLVSGVLFSGGLDVRRGLVVTGPGKLDALPIPSGVFAGRLMIESQASDTLPTDLRRNIGTQIERLVERSKSQGVEAVREELITLFCLRMEATQHSDSLTSDLRIVDSPAQDNTATVVTIRSADNPGFLFELSNALNLCRFRIRRAEANAEENQVRDQLWITESEQQLPLTEARIQEIHSAVTLIQQFTLWLPNSADPGPVLLRFRRLLDTLLRKGNHTHGERILRNPDVLQRVARVLGLSRHLWEDALQHDSYLIPFLAAPDMLTSPADASALRQEAEAALQQIQERSPQRAAEVLNLFKDQHLFRIELRHVLGHCQSFGDFSQEITTLAEISLEMAAELAWAELSQQKTSGASVPNCPWTLAGLGKFGGVEIGYASDIELLLIYDSADHQRDGRWFERLLIKTTEIVASRRDGIFEIDLRMRPWGQAGSAAVSLEQFQSYYSSTGNAWPYERQSLLKLRSFGSNAKFGRKIMSVRDRLIYDDHRFDFAAMNGLREQQVRQHVQPGTIHAKLSEGCLVDIEYSVQALQLMHGHAHSALRTANTLDALHAVQQSALLPEHLCESSKAAYAYFRQLIDCLRMVRGNAKDLQVPAEATEDRARLERRLAQIYTDEVSLSGLNGHRSVVAQLVAAVRETATRHDN